MRHNAFVRARGRQDGKHEHASEASGQLRGLGQKVRAHGLATARSRGRRKPSRFAAFRKFSTAITGKFYVKLLALKDMRCLGLESISGLGSFLTAESCGTSGLDRLREGAYILTEGQSLCVPYGFLPVIIWRRARRSEKALTNGCQKRQNKNINGQISRMTS